MVLLSSVKLVRLQRSGADTNIDKMNDLFGRIGGCLALVGWLAGLFLEFVSFFCFGFVCFAFFG